MSRLNRAASLDSLFAMQMCSRTMPVQQSLSLTSSMTAAIALQHSISPLAIILGVTDMALFLMHQKLHVDCFGSPSVLTSLTIPLM